MTNKESLKKQIIYRSTHRGSKEMDILLGAFVKTHIEKFDDETIKNKRTKIYDHIFEAYEDSTNSVYSL